MKRCSLFCAGWWPFIVFPLLLLLPLLFFKWHAIERDVAKNALTKLKENHIEWATVETYNDGRNVLITGIAPSVIDAKNAEIITSQAKGVRFARFHDIEGAIAAPSPSHINAIVTGDSLVLRGTLANQSDIELLVSQAARTFGSNKVINKLEVGRNISEPPNTNGLFKALYGQAELGTLSVEISSHSLSVTGEVLDPESKKRLESSFKKIFKGEISNQLSIATPVKRQSCEDLLKELLASGKINFESGKDTVTKDSYTLLERLANTAKRCPNAEFEVAGHTDSFGNLAFNLSLSERRASAVVNHLEELGLDISKFSPKGYGPNQPIASNDTAQGRADNRRIEFNLQN